VTFEALPDEELTDRWEASTLGGTGISHRDHLRIAWVLVHRHGAEEAEKRLVEGTRRSCSAYGVPERFDEALTRQWAFAVADALRRNPGEGGFEGFLAANPQLEEGDLLGRPEWIDPVEAD
jgi:hypothetical protein